MPKNKMSDLRDHMFEVFEGVKDGTLDIHRAKALANIAQVIINSASAEVRAVNAYNALGDNARGSNFFELPAAEQRDDPAPKRLSGAPSAAPGEGIHAIDPLRARLPEPAEGRK